MKIRLDGTKEEATKFAEDLEMYYDVIRVCMVLLQGPCVGET